MSDKEKTENLEEVIEVVETTEDEGTKAEDIVSNDETNTDEKIQEESEEIQEEILSLEKEKKVVEIDTNPSIFKKIFASLLDQALVLGFSAVFLLIFDFFIGFIGYMVEQPTPVLLIIYGIFNVLYYPLIEGKSKRSIGKRILSIG